MNEPEYLSLDEANFGTHFPWQPFAVAHRLQDHPLFEPDALVKLCEQLPAGQIEYNRASLPVNVTREQTPANGMSAQETIDSIAENDSWLVMKYIETVEPYKALLDACLDQVYPYARSTLSELHQRAGFIFISSPGAVTPFHMDPEHNFLLQIKGGKVMRTWDPEDREVLPESAIEQHYMPGSHRNLNYHPHFDQRATAHELTPGRGLYVPVHAPHWVQVGDQVSVSFSITFKSGWSYRNADRHHANIWLKSRGMAPIPPGGRAVSDRCKMLLYRANRKLRHLHGR